MKIDAVIDKVLLEVTIVGLVFLEVVVLDVDVVFKVEIAVRFRPRDRDWLELMLCLRGSVGCWYCTVYGTLHQTQRTARRGKKQQDLCIKIRISHESALVAMRG
jgi:hypothetical protein